MRAVQRSFALILVFGMLLLAVFYSWGPVRTEINVRPREWGKLEPLTGKMLQGSLSSYNHIPYHVKESILIRLPLNGCVCESEKKSIELPFSNLLFPRVWAHNLAAALPDSDREIVKSRRAHAYDSFVKRSYTPTDLLIVAEANSPLQYPTQGVKVQPLKTIIIPGLGIEENSRPIHSVNLTATLGTFDVAANVDGVLIRGLGEMHMTLSSKVLPHLNRQLQFVTYTNTLFHPKTADTVQFETHEHQSIFTIKVGHGNMPKLFNSGSEKDEYNISALLTIATKTFLRYDKLQDLITSIRQYYPDVTIVIADDNKDPQPVTGPHIEHYTMPFGKGWFAGRNLAVSQVTTKYVLWVDDDFLFSANTKLEKMVDILEKTTLDLVGGAVREVTGYTATFRHTISVEQGGYEGDCLHMRTGYHHTIQGFPNCVVADAVINFFLARADKMLQVGFDPRLSRAAHLEFFVDGLGSLHIGSCSDVIVNHASKIKLPWGQTENEKAYAKFRYSLADGGNVHDELYYFKNRFKCITGN